MAKFSSKLLPRRRFSTSTKSQQPFDHIKRTRAQSGGRELNQADGRASGLLAQFDNLGFEASQL